MKNQPFKLIFACMQILSSRQKLEYIYTLISALLNNDSVDTCSERCFRQTELPGIPKSSRQRQSVTP